MSKGVKVDLGIPQELWDKPSAEITQLKTQCEALLENYEEDIEDWYFNNQVIPTDWCPSIAQVVVVCLSISI